MEKLGYFCFILVLVTMLSGCATLLSGESNKIYFHTTPAGATIKVNGEKVGESGEEVLLKKRLKKKQVELSKPGYETKTFEIETSFDPVSLLNIIGLYGFAVDWATGRLVKYDNLYYDIDLVPIEAKKDY